MATVTFAKRPACRGSNVSEIEAARNGRPFARLWTTRDTAATKDCWHVHLAAGESRNFLPWTPHPAGYPASGPHGSKAAALRAAKAWIAQQAQG